MHVQKSIQIIYSQLYIADGLTSAYMNEELAEHENQGFSVRRNSVAVQSTVDEQYEVHVTDDAFDESALLDAVFAVRIPCRFDSGFVFVEGMMLPAPVSLVEVFCKEPPTESELQDLANTSNYLIFPAKGVSSLVFVEQAHHLVRVYLERNCPTATRLLVANDQYPRQADFLENTAAFSL